MKGIIKELLGWIVFIFIVIAASYLVVTYVGQRTEVSGSSMETTLSDGDQLIVDKISYRFRDPSRYDIVVFPYRYEENTYYIKRIIGLIHRNELLGRAWVRIWPFSEFGVIKHE